MEEENNLKKVSQINYVDNNQNEDIFFDNTLNAPDMSNQSFEGFKDFNLNCEKYIYIGHNEGQQNVNYEFNLEQFSFEKSFQVPESAVDMQTKLENKQNQKSFNSSKEIQINNESGKEGTKELRNQSNEIDDQESVCSCSDCEREKINLLINRENNQLQQQPVQQQEPINKQNSTQKSDFETPGGPDEETPGGEENEETPQGNEVDETPGGPDEETPGGEYETPGNYGNVDENQNQQQNQTNEIINLDLIPQSSQQNQQFSYQQQQQQINSSSTNINQYEVQTQLINKQLQQDEEMTQNIQIQNIQTQNYTMDDNNRLDFQMPVLQNDSFDFSISKIMKKFQQISNTQHFQSIEFNQFEAQRMEFSKEIRDLQQNVQDIGIKQNQIKESFDNPYGFSQSFNLDYEQNEFTKIQNKQIQQIQQPSIIQPKKSNYFFDQINNNDEDQQEYQNQNEATCYLFKAPQINDNQDNKTILENQNYQGDIRIQSIDVEPEILLKPQNNYNIPDQCQQFQHKIEDFHPIQKKIKLNHLPVQDQNMAHINYESKIEIDEQNQFNTYYTKSNEDHLDEITEEYINEHKKQIQEYLQILLLYKSTSAKQQWIAGDFSKNIITHKLIKFWHPELNYKQRIEKYQSLSNKDGRNSIKKFENMLILQLDTNIVKNFIVDLKLEMEQEIDLVYLQQYPFECELVDGNYKDTCNQIMHKEKSGKRGLVNKQGRDAEIERFQTNTSRKISCFIAFELIIKTYGQMYFKNMNQNYIESTKMKKYNFPNDIVVFRQLNLQQQSQNVYQKKIIRSFVMAIKKDPKSFLSMAFLVFAPFGYYYYRQNIYQLQKKMYQSEESALTDHEQNNDKNDITNQLQNDCNYSPQKN